MLVGNGMIASAFMNYSNNSDVLIFASGVSNSQDSNNQDFERERNLLKQNLNNIQRIVYFSTCSIYDPELANSAYVLHKLEMESLVKNCSRHLICRLPQVVGMSTNSNTLANFLYNKIANDELIKVWGFAKRNLIDVDDVELITSYLLKHDYFDENIVNIACPFSVSIIEIIKVFEVALNKKANIFMIEAGGAYGIDTAIVESVAKVAGVNFDKAYVERVVKKYYRTINHL